MKRVVIVGPRGQDGRLLRESLEARGDEVIGFGREDGPLTDRAKVAALLSARQPHEVYYLAAYHHSAEDAVAEDDAECYRRSEEVHVAGLLSFLEGIRAQSPSTRLVYAASSHIFGEPASSPQDESTPLQPVNIYGITKAAGVHCCRFYRQSRGVFATVGILYNHESPYRKKTFVSQKIVQGALAIQAGRESKLAMGNLSARVDWGSARDYVHAMQLTLALDQPDDFVIATGETHTVGEFVEIVFSALDLDWRAHVVENPALLRKNAITLCGNPRRLRERAGWQPTFSFQSMTEELLTHARHAR